MQQSVTCTAVLLPVNGHMSPALDEHVNHLQLHGSSQCCTTCSAMHAVLTCLHHVAMMRYMHWFTGYTVDTYFWIP
jgi:hypothetical protein